MYKVKDSEKAEGVPPSFPACQDRRDRPAQACSRWCQSECKYASYRQGALAHLPTSAWHPLQMHPVAQLTKVRKGTNLLITKQTYRNTSLGGKKLGLLQMESGYFWNSGTQTNLWQTRNLLNSMLQLPWLSRFSLGNENATSHWWHQMPCKN